MAFKGVDIAIYKVFKAMGFEVLIKPLLDTSPLDKFDEKLFREETEKKRANSGYRSWLEDEYYFGSFLCHNCDNEWPSWRQWRDHTYKATSKN
jgi:hypothetical protein